MHFRRELRSTRPRGPSASNLLDATVHNQTGFALGYDMNFEALGVDAVIGDLGPVQVGRLQNDAAIRLPAFCCDEFSIGLPSIETPSIALDVRSPIWKDGVQIGDVETIVHVEESGQAGQYLIKLEANDRLYEQLASGRLVTFADALRPDREQVMLELDEAVYFELAGGGRLEFETGFCVLCSDNSELLQGFNPSIVDGDEQMYISKLFDFPSGEVDEASDPWLNGHASLISDLKPPITSLDDPQARDDFGFGPITNVPEPASWLSMLAGLAAIGVLRRRLAEHRGP